MCAHIKVQMGHAPWHAFWPKVYFVQQVICLCGRPILGLETVPPVLFADRLVVIIRPDAVHGPDVFDLALSLVRNAVSDEQCAPRRCWRWLVRTLAER